MPKNYGKYNIKKNKKLKNQYLIKYLMIKAGNDNPTIKDQLKSIFEKLTIQ